MNNGKVMNGQAGAGFFAGQANGQAGVGLLAGHANGLAGGVLNGGVGIIVPHPVAAGQEACVGKDVAIWVGDGEMGVKDWLESLGFAKEEVKEIGAALVKQKYYYLSELLRYPITERDLQKYGVACGRDRKKLLHDLHERREALHGFENGQEEVGFFDNEEIELVEKHKNFRKIISQARFKKLLKTNYWNGIGVVLTVLLGIIQICLVFMYTPNAQCLNVPNQIRL
eukprot:TRINITY_DN599_c0_g1_i3.p2 TRINITY_DN599_c0_g1~~TRINITY_DN599_c0_g1_i3.p2  ORF type:complete len:226 (-),score=29.96 TRINITY_DN599_c0_g1_i3:81-758(-)